MWHGRANSDGDGLGGRGSVLLQPFALVPSVARMPASAAPAPFGLRSEVLLKLEADTVLLLLALLLAASSVSSKFSPVCPPSSGRRYWNRRWCWPLQPRPHSVEDAEAIVLLPCSQLCIARRARAR